MKISIRANERFPDYSFGNTSVHNDGGKEADVDQDTIDRWRKINAEYCDMQNELEQLYNRSVK